MHVDEKTMKRKRKRRQKTTSAEEQRKERREHETKDLGFGNTLKKTKLKD